MFFSSCLFLRRGGINFCNVHLVALTWLHSDFLNTCQFYIYIETLDLTLRRYKQLFFSFFFSIRLLLQATWICQYKNSIIDNMGIYQMNTYYKAYRNNIAVSINYYVFVAQLRQNGKEIKSGLQCCNYCVLWYLCDN